VLLDRPNVRPGDDMPFRGMLRERRGRRVVRLVLVAVSVVCIGAGLLLAGHIAWFIRSSSVHGAALVQRERRAISVSAPAAPTCQSLGHQDGVPAASGKPQGLLEIPVLGLTAPVLQGTGDTCVARAAGNERPGRSRRDLVLRDRPAQAGRRDAVRHAVPYFHLPGHVPPRRGRRLPRLQHGCGENRP
jgi:hypothetical protein